MIEHVVCISLDRRPDRWEAFLEQLPPDWPFGPVQRFAAIDGQECALPDWYGAIPPGLNHPPRDWPADFRGAWGCLQSHLAVWAMIEANNWDRVLILEDDALFCCAFGLHVRDFLGAVPDDWEWLYLGGEHVGNRRDWPERVNDRVLRCKGVCRTHAYVLRREIVPALRFVLNERVEGGARPQDYYLDHRLSVIHPDFRVYAPRQWLVGQAAGESDVRSGTQWEPRWWRRFHVAEDRAAEEDSGGQAARKIV